MFSRYILLKYLTANWRLGYAKINFFKPYGDINGGDI